MNTTSHTRPLSKRFSIGLTSGIMGALPLFFTLYVISLTCSMSGMEISSWSLVIFFLIAVAVDRITKARKIKFHTIGVELPILCLFIVVALGLKLNAPQADFPFYFFKLRNLFLLYFFCYAFQYAGNLNRYFTTLVTAATLVALYGIWQHFSGQDLWHIWRGEPNAIDIVPSGDKTRFSTIGLFGHHLTFAHSYMMIVTVPWAALLLGRRQGWSRKLLYGLSFAIILTAIVFTFGRGVWIALAIALPIMALFVSRKLFLAVVLFLGLSGYAAYRFNPNIQFRVNTLAQQGYFSNEDRKNLWAINMEMFYDNPWLGVGWMQNEEMCVPYFKKLQIENGMAGHAHSNYIQFLSTTGVLGTLCYMLFIIAFMLMTLRLYSSIPATHYWHRVFVLAGIGAQIAFHIGGLTQWNFGDAEVQHLFLFWLAVIAYMNERYHLGIVPDDRSL